MRRLIKTMLCGDRSIDHTGVNTASSKSSLIPGILPELLKIRCLAIGTLHFMVTGHWPCWLSSKILNLFIGNWLMSLADGSPRTKAKAKYC